MARLHQDNFGTNLTFGTSAGATTSPLNSIPTIAAPFYLAFDATNLNSHFEIVDATSKTATNVNHAATTYDHTIAEEVRMVVPAVELDGFPQGKATGAEINTGTDDAKFVTAKAIADSAVVKAGTLPAFLIRAWVQFTGGTGTQTINASGNVASVTRNSTGQCTITFTNAMPDTNYAVFVSSDNGVSDAGNADYCLSRAVGSCGVRHFEAGTARDFNTASVIIVR